MLENGTGRLLCLATLASARLKQPAYPGMVPGLRGEVQLVLTRSFETGPAVKGVGHAWYARLCLE